MKKYLFKRILFSIFSLLAVVFIVMTLIYKAINPEVIFQNDSCKMQNNDLEVYKQGKLERYGYLDFHSYSDFVKDDFTATYGTSFVDNEEIYEKYFQKVSAIKKYESKKIGADKQMTNIPNTIDELIQVNITLNNEENVDYIKEFREYYEAKGYTVKFLPWVVGKDKYGRYMYSNKSNGGEPALYAIKNFGVFKRMWNYMRDFITIETTKDIVDDNLTDRYIKIKWDKLSNMPALVGSGTTHKYLIYFDDVFPYIHQNLIHLNLGTSSQIVPDGDITEYINLKTGDQVKEDVYYPNQLDDNGQPVEGAKSVNLSLDFHMATYSPKPSESSLNLYGDNYVIVPTKTGGLSRIENSFVIGLIATIIAYLLGLPLGVLMARRKDKLADKIGMAYIIFIMAVPSLVYIFIFAAIGTKVFNLPYKMSNAEVKVLGYILPTISLALPSVGGLMKWMRRYMIDQMNSDYVKFARSQGLSEKEIFSKHISKNAMIYIVHGIPGSILGCLTGAIITESVYGVEGIGKLITTAISKHDNGVIVACTVFFTTLSIVSLILGDLLLATYDPRISLTEGGGR